MADASPPTSGQPPPPRRRLRHHLILQGLIADRRMSYQEFATAVGVHKGTVCNWCAGNRRTLNEGHASKVLEVLGVDSDVLFLPNDSLYGGHAVDAEGMAS